MLKWIRSGGQFHDAYHKTKINLINLSATLKKLNKNSETCTQHNYLFKTIFIVVAKFIFTYKCYTTTYFFSFYPSEFRGNNKAWYIKIAVCINISP